MRIGIDARLWDETGVGRYIRNLLWQLQEIDQENEYVLFVKGQKVLSTSQTVEEKFRIQNSEFRIVETDIHWHSVREQTSFARVLSKEKLDLMHFPYFSLPIFYKKPFVVTIHDLIFHHFSSGRASTLPLPLFHAKREGFKHVFNHALGSSQAIIVPLQCVKDELTKQFGVSEKKIVVTKEGFDTALLSSADVSEDIRSISKNGKYFLYVGNAYPHKNVEFLLRSFLRFQKEHHEYRLVVVIKDDMFLRELRQSFSNDALEYLSGVTDSELGYLYRHAEAFVSASLMEGFGLPPLEAMAIGTPVILSEIPAFSEVCGETAWYFDPESEESLISVLKEFVNTSATQRSKKIMNGKDLIVGFSWEKMAKETLHVYKSALQK